VVKANETFLALVGYERDELIGRLRFADLLSPGGRIYHETHYAPMLRMQGVASEIALDLVRRDGTRTPVLVNAVLESDADGKPLVVRTAVFDATHRREYERELLRAKQRAEASEERSRALARTLQQTLIPPTPPEIPGLDIATRYRPAGDGTEVGGDFYDLFSVGGEWVVAIGDVCGKGAEAAVVTALVRYTLRAAAVQHPNPAAALATLNAVLQRHETDRFCTVAFLRLRERSGGWQALLCLGGHPAPLLRRPGESLQVLGEPGSVLGVMDDPDLHDIPVTLRAGDVLLLYTDGLPDGRRGSEFYGDQRLAGLLATEHDAAEGLASALLDDVLAFQGGTARDDIAIVVVRVPDAQVAEV
jgi:sigma-B regulation protein RsbU (phosphoserine phosphatase)